MLEPNDDDGLVCCPDDSRAVCGWQGHTPLSCTGPRNKTKRSRGEILWNPFFFSFPVTKGQVIVRLMVIKDLEVLVEVMNGQT